MSVVQKSPVESRKAARRSRSIALAVRVKTGGKIQAVRVCQESCKRAGILHAWEHGKLLEELLYRVTITGSPYGAYEPDATLAARLGITVRQLRTRRDNLVDAGLVESQLGIPPGGTGPVHHYRLLELFNTLAQSILMVADVVKTVAKKVVRTVWKKTSELLSTKKTSTKAFAKPVHNLPKNEPVSAVQVSEKPVGNAWIALMRRPKVVQEARL